MHTAVCSSTSPACPPSSVPATCTRAASTAGPLPAGPKAWLIAGLRSSSDSRYVSAHRPIAHTAASSTLHHPLQLVCNSDCGFVLTGADVNKAIERHASTCIYLPLLWWYVSSPAQQRLCLSLSGELEVSSSQRQPRPQQQAWPHTDTEFGYECIWISAQVLAWGSCWGPGRGPGSCLPPPAVHWM